MNIVDIVRSNKLSEVDDTRCHHLYSVMAEIRDKNIPGDLVETGIYKGGCSMIMAWCNLEFKLKKTLYCYDSFEGCPEPNDTIIGRHKDEAHGKGDFACDLATVTKNFDSFNLLTPDVVFIPGWFENTTKEHKPKSIALLRFDGDLYSSTLDVLRNLYPLVVSGGYVIIDDYCLDACRQAVHQYFHEENLDIKVNKVPGNDDSCGSWWIK